VALTVLERLRAVPASLVIITMRRPGFAPKAIALITAVIPTYPKALTSFSHRAKMRKEQFLRTGYKPSRKNFPAR
jgi:hypothetical protein